jgi:hypothetical protein
MMVVNSKLLAKLNKMTEFWSSGANEDLNCDAAMKVWCGSNRTEFRKGDVKMTWIEPISATDRCLALRLDGRQFSLQYANCGSAKLSFICEVRIWMGK